MSFFGDDDPGFGTEEDPGTSLGEAPDAPPGGYVDDTTDDPAFGAQTGISGLGEDPNAPPDAQTVDDTTGPAGDPDSKKESAFQMEPISKCEVGY